jgi:hypothetical protein
VSIFNLFPHGNGTFTTNTCCYSWGSGQLGATPVGTANISYGAGHSWCHGTNTLASQRRLGKRPRSDDLTGNGSEELYDDRRPRPFKKVKGKTVARGVLEAAGSTSRAPLKSATKTPGEFSDTSEAVGRGAGMLAAPSGHEVYHQLLPGPSVQMLVGTTVSGEPSPIEGSEVEATQHYTNGVVQPPVLYSNAGVGEREDQERTRFRIPKRLSERHRSLLVASSEDLARGTVRELKCRLCPGTGISNWGDFKRHCDTMEAHPLKISFCKYCGDFFARSDALKRHQQRRPATCHGVSLAEAQAKRTATKQAHDAFLGELESLGTSGEAWTPFSQRITEMLTNSAKRGSRQQSRIKGPNL